MENTISSTMIVEKLKNIIKSRFGVDFKEDLDAHLLGASVGMDHMTLIYLFFDIEKEFDIIIPQQDIVAGNFTSINNIVNIVSGQIKLKEGMAL
jgi:peptide maturation system acyl carrier-related protein